MPLAKKIQIVRHTHLAIVRNEQFVYACAPQIRVDRHRRNYSVWFPETVSCPLCLKYLAKEKKSEKQRQQETNND